MGVVFQDPEGRTAAEISQSIGHATNNVAEYSALIFALQEGIILGAKELEIRTDSELLARQFHGQYKVKDSSIKFLYTFVRHLLRGFDKVTVTHVPREQNKTADRLANEALDGKDLFL